MFAPANTFVINGNPKHAIVRNLKKVRKGKIPQEHFVENFTFAHGCIYGSGPIHSWSMDSLPKAKLANTITELNTTPKNAFNDLRQACWYSDEYYISQEDLAILARVLHAKHSPPNNYPDMDTKDLATLRA
jgi:hypothetical protein